MKKSVTLGQVTDGTRLLFTPTDLQHLQALGAQMVRLEFRLAGHQQWDWDSAILGLYGQALALLSGAGIGVIGLIVNDAVPGPHNQQADWNKNATEQGGTDGTNAFQTAYAQVCATLATAFPAVSTWEVWNEPNAWTAQPSPGVYTGGTWMYPSCYAALLTRTRAALTAAYPGDYIITGGLLALTQFGTDYGHSAAAYLHAVYDAGGWYNGSEPFAGVGYHYYGDGGHSFVPQHLVGYLDDLYQTMGWYDDPAATKAKPVYVTETGWKSDTTGAQQQAVNLSAAFGVLADDPRVALASWFCLTDSSAGQYGLYDSAGNARPAAQAFSAVQQGA